MRSQTLLFITGNVLTITNAAFVNINPHLPAITPAPILHPRQQQNQTSSSSNTEPSPTTSFDELANASSCTSSIFSYISKSPHPELDPHLITLFEASGPSPTGVPNMLFVDICSNVNYQIYAPPPRIKIPKSLTSAWTSYSTEYLRWAFKAKTELSAVGTRCLTEHRDTMGALSAMLIAATDIPSCKGAFSAVPGWEGLDVPVTTGTSTGGAVGARETGVAGFMGVVAVAGVAVMGVM
ncbi:hypothetical protein QBC38DRAFT_541177 [Podospora fimiseda]|uniref:Infection structure specific protein n=1 Tax=Podospora fimiseda TaxID=252190 RepID=A0AAN7H4K7_9PEZI|nr:hypothetical protein QBC38DRAFT_541177 [Podospora fimiseda]